MGGNKLILNNQLHHEIPVVHVQRVLANMLETIGEQDVYEVGYASTMREASMAIVKTVHVNSI
jgi:hypothetical protein